MHKYWNKKYWYGMALRLLRMIIGFFVFIVLGGIVIYISSPERWPEPVVQQGSQGG